jgi:hypothetical protein
MPINKEQHIEQIDCRYVTRCSMSPDFTTYQEVIEFIFDDEGHMDKDNVVIDYISTGKEILEAMGNAGKAKRRDTSVGGNDAVNCYHSFNENDDLIHPLHQINGEESKGLGRVYNETFDTQQQIIHMSFGVPDFKSLAGFYTKLIDSDLAKLMNNGDVSILGTIGTIMGRTLGTVIMLPFLPVVWASKLLSGNLFQPPAKYYEFKPAMPLYYKLVNVMLAHLSVNMDLVDDGRAGVSAGTPDLLKFHGVDILTILSKKSHYDNLLTDYKSMTTDEYAKQVTEDDSDNPGGFWKGVIDGQTEALLYVGFRVDKGISNTESASNSTKEPSIASAINEKAKAGREKTFTLKSLAAGGGAGIESLIKGITGFIDGTAEKLMLSGGLEILKGSGYIDIPEVWDSSAFSKSYTFDFKLRTVGADKFSIFYSLYIQLAMMLAGAFPRAVGPNAYTSPFLVRAYCKGMFAIPMGIIDSITIKRGADEYGWSINHLPTQIDISFTIKDLSPIMYVALSSGSVWKDVLGQNSSFQEYLLTLSGVGVADRVLFSKNMIRRAKTILKIKANNMFNPQMMGFTLSAGTGVGRAMARMYPSSKLPDING